MCMKSYGTCRDGKAYLMLTVARKLYNEVDPVSL